MEYMEFLANLDIISIVCLMLRAVLITDAKALLNLKTPKFPNGRNPNWSLKYPNKITKVTH